MINSWIIFGTEVAMLLGASWFIDWLIDTSSLAVSSTSAVCLMALLKNS